MTIIPNDNDVLFGRGYAIMNHSGNKQLRVKVKAQKEKFLQSNKVNKRNIAITIVDEVLTSNARFLMEDPNNKISNKEASSLVQKVWIVVERERAVNKVMHLFREKEKGGKKSKKEKNAAPIAKSGDDEIASSNESKTGPQQAAVGSSMQQNSVSPGSYSTGAVSVAVPLDVPSSNAATSNLDMLQLQLIVNNAIMNKAPPNNAMIHSNSSSLQSMLQSVVGSGNSNHSVNNLLNSSNAPVNLLNNILMGIQQTQQPMTPTAGLVSLPSGTAMSSTASSSVLGDRPQLQSIGGNPFLLNNLVATIPSSNYRSSLNNPPTRAVGNDVQLSKDNLLSGILDKIATQQSNSLINNSSLQNQTIGGGATITLANHSSTMTNSTLQNQLLQSVMGRSSLDNDVARASAMTSLNHSGNSGINNMASTQQSIHQERPWLQIAGNTPLDDIVARDGASQDSTDSGSKSILSVLRDNVLKVTNMAKRQQSNNDPVFKNVARSSLEENTLLQPVGSASHENSDRGAGALSSPGNLLSSSSSINNSNNMLQSSAVGANALDPSSSVPASNHLQINRLLNPFQSAAGIAVSSLENAAREEDGGASPSSSSGDPMSSCDSIIKNVLGPSGALQQNSIKSDALALDNALKQNTKSDHCNDQTITRLMKRLADGSGAGQGCVHLLSSDKMTTGNTSNTFAAAVNNAPHRSQDDPTSRVFSMNTKPEATILTATKDSSIGHSAPAFDVDDPISIKEWMDDVTVNSDMSSKEAYILSALELALVLTRKLSYLIGSRTAIDPEDISIEKVLVYMERQRPFSSSRDPLSIHGSVHEVKFPGESSVTHLLSQQRNDAGTLQPRAACASLGKLLLQIFTQNRSISLSSAEQTPQNKYPGSNEDTSGAVAPPPKKRKMPALSSDSISSNKAHNLLLQLEMPLSICQLVCDLLDAETEGPTTSSTSLTSMDEVLFNLEQMKTNPASFLFDRICPQGALDDTQLFNSTDSSLVGREKEMTALLNAKAVCMEGIDNRNPAASASVQQQQQRSSFHCEAAFLSGYAGSGKSSLIRSLTSSCEEDQWFVLGCKFDKQTAPHTVLFRAFDDFFGKCIQGCIGDTIADSSNSDHLSSSMISSFRKACRGIVSAMDEDGLDQLSDLVPNVAKIFPIVAAKSNNSKNDSGISSMDKVGSAHKRLQNLFHVVLKSLCSARCPVLFVIDDLQWSDTFIMETLSDFVVSYMYGDISSVDGDKSRAGLFIVGAYRSNEVAEGDVLLRMIEYLKQSRKVNVTTMTIGQLTITDVTQLISTKLCLPCRYTRELAGLVHSKTRGNPFFVIQFLRTLVQNKLLEYSILSRRWMWDCDCVEMQMIPDGVADMLTASFNQLPSELVQTMKIVSCLGYQVESSVIHILNLKKDILPSCMLDQMQLAVKEGLIEKAGPLYQFTHDIIKETVYELIPAENRGSLHKAIGLSLLAPRLNGTTIHLLAVDQINTYLCNDGVPAPEEHTMFASINAQAAKFALASSSFQQARSYINAGMKLLQANHWDTQYDLSLALFEMSASVSCIRGDNATMSDCLSELLSHAKSFDDSLAGAGLLVKMLASNSKYDEARSNCFDILLNLGEEFPADVSLPLVLNELSNATSALKDISHDLMKALPRMTDRTKLNAMKFLNMLCMYSGISKPLLLPILSCRMVKLTLQFGFCDDSIVGIATVGYSLFMLTEDLPLATHLGQVSESLMEESPKKNILKSRLALELFSTLGMTNRHCHSQLSRFPEYYNSAMLSGDIESAMLCRFSFFHGRFWTGAACVSTTIKGFTMCMKEAAKYEMQSLVYSFMVELNSCSLLSGKSCTEEMEVKTLDELDAVVETDLLIFRIFLSRLFVSFWMHDYAAVAELSEEYNRKHPSAQQKRIMHILRAFCEGIAYLSLARSGQQPAWRALGEKAVATITHFEMTMSKENMENKSQLLKAELCYLNGDLDSAEAAYKDSINSACEQKFIHEEALAYEQYGRFLVENHNSKQGLVQLRLALDKYKEWGVMKKVHNLKFYVDSVELQTDLI